MPELPEIETIKRQLEEKAVGLKIEKVDIRLKKLFVGEINDLIGVKIVGVRRRAKLLIIDLENKKHMLFHLKMSGQLIFEDRNGKFGGGHPVPPFSKPVPHSATHVIFYLSGNNILYFNELRQFGWVKVVNDKQLEENFSKVGPEPLSELFTLEKFSKIIEKRPKSKIKQILMDQSTIAGIGNIYASEICYYAKVMPTRSIGSLTKDEKKLLHEGIKKILPVAIKYQGTSADSYVTLAGEKGTYIKYLKVYGRQGQKCLRNDGGVIEKIKQGGRGTFFCSVCQK